MRTSSSRQTWLPLGLSGLAVLSLVIGACGSDDGNNVDGAVSPDGSTTDGTVTLLDSGSDALASGDTQQDAILEVECTDKADGTVCAAGSVCLQKICVASSCGDGYVDVAQGEDCEDGNEVTGDGCSSCRFDCKADSDCSDGNACTGVETCDKTMPLKPVCKAGTPATAGSACMLPGGAAGKCSNNACVTASCGNSAVDAGEQCDDGNANDDDGCTRECKFTCAASADCNDGNKCNGDETCDTNTHKCAAGTVVVCTAATCTMSGMCDPATGACSYGDGDKDGKACNVDCNDADPAVFPGAFECKDGKDNDCSTATSDTVAPSCECYVDTDKDGYASSVTGAITASGVCPAGYTRTKPVAVDTIDCGPRAASANPAQTAFFPTAYCPNNLNLCLVGSGSFDYNCNKVEEPFDSSLASATCVGAASRLLCSFRSGWITKVPQCGQKGTYRTCSWLANVGCVGSDAANVTQTCR